MSTSDVPSRPEIILLVLGYLSIAQAHTLPNGVAILGYVSGFFLFVLIPLLVLDGTDSRPDVKRCVVLPRVASRRWSTDNRLWPRFSL